MRQWQKDLLMVIAILALSFVASMAYLSASK